MTEDIFVDTIFLVFSGAAVLATLALAARQTLLMAYIALGVLFGPSVLGLVPDGELTAEIAHIGIMFLLFLLGLDLNPRELAHSLRRTSLVTFASSLVFAVIGLSIGLAFSFSFLDALILGAAMTFSSTIIGLKLLPTTVLHHQRMGEIMISVLLLQDLIAIATLLLLGATISGNTSWVDIFLVLLSLPGLALFSWACARFILLPLMARFDTFREYIFLVAIGWCLGMAELAGTFGLSHEIGAFFAGVGLATSPIAMYIADSLRPLRDFFLVLFFFSVGAQFDIAMIDDVFAPAALTAIAAIVLKPLIFKALLVATGETRSKATEIGFRLGQMSEFSMLLAALAMNITAVSAQVSYTIQLATIVTFVVSSYLVVLRFPTPIAIRDELRRD